MNIQTPNFGRRDARVPRTLTRADLAEAIQRRLEVSGTKSVGLVELVLQEMLDVIASGNELTLRSFGSFHIHSKKERPGRNPKTGANAPVSARRSVTFKPSSILRDKVNESNGFYPKR